MSPEYFIKSVLKDVSQSFLAIFNCSPQVFSCFSLVTTLCQPCVKCACMCLECVSYMYLHILAVVLVHTLLLVLIDCLHELAPPVYDNGRNCYCVFFGLDGGLLEYQC